MTMTMIKPIAHRRLTDVDAATTTHVRFMDESRIPKSSQSLRDVKDDIQRIA
jgi:hypothetical protein